MLKLLPLIFALLSLVASVSAISSALSFSPKPTQATFGWSYAAANKTTSYQIPPNATPVYATANVKSNTTKYYAPHYSEASTLLGSLTTTTWGNWRPVPKNTTASAKAESDPGNPYGEEAWSSLWERASVPSFTVTALYNTTVEPTMIPTQSLILPPAEEAYSFDETLSFPSDFVFGVAGSAVQIEGAVADEGRSPTIIDTLFPGNTPKDYDTVENYYLYKHDIARIAAMGIKYYSFSIPWTRILPFVLPNTPVNKDGLHHYDDLINTCLEYGITPIATLVHFDTPWIFNGGNVSINAEIGPNGGYDNSSFVDAFINYGKIVLTHFADRVPIWITYNQPLNLAGNVIGVKNIIQSHHAIYKFYHDELKASGKMGIKLSDYFGVPRDTNKPEDIKAAVRFQEYYLGSIGNPLFLGRDYPESWKATFNNSKLSNFTFSPQELQDFQGSADFFGIDPYTYSVVTSPPGGIEACQANSSNPNWPLCVVSSDTRKDGWQIGYKSQGHVYSTPLYLRRILNYIWDTFKSPIMVAEFGFPEWRESEKILQDQLFDDVRSIYLRSYLQSMLQAIHLDKIPVVGALVWSFSDNWELGDYSQQYGLQVVNRTTQERYYKKSFFDIVKYVEDRREK